jgi:hypothetical protein
MGWGRILSIMLMLASGAAAAQAPWPTQQQPRQQQQAAWPAQQQPQQQQQAAWPAQQPQQQSSWPSQQQQSPAQSAWPSQQAGAAPGAPMMAPGGGMPAGGGMPPGGGMMSPMGQGGGQMPPCFAEFAKLRGDVEKYGPLVRTAQEQHVAREELCKLFSSMSAASIKWTKFTATKAKECGIPPDAVKQIKGQDDHIAMIKKQVCSGGGGPAAPSLAEALGTDKLPLDESEKKQVKRGGVLDSLTGAPIR